MSGQSVRRSQFITTYGPGAIIEGAEGPRIIPTLGRSQMFAGSVNIDDFEITDSRLSTNLLNDAKIVGIPSNAQLGIPEAQTVYHTDPFPKWSLCLQHRVGILYSKRSSDNHACPQCATESSAPAAWRKAGREKVRFIQCCPNGHLGDVNWRAVVSSLGGCAGGCRPDYYLWRGGGGSLRDVNIECPVCGGVANLGLAYSRQWRCEGVFPEEGNVATGCTTHASIVQRGAANIFVPEIVSALTIPETALVIHRLLGQRAILTVLRMMPPRDYADLQMLLERLIQNNLVTRSTRDTILAHGEADVMRAVGDLLADVGQQTPREMRLAEFRSLVDAASRGYPHSGNGGEPLFEVIRNNVQTFQGPSGGLIRVTPVSRLRVVMVQTGYRRLNGIPVDRCASINNERWYPGVELFGEGIFIDLVDELGVPRPFAPNGMEASQWQAAKDGAEAGQPAYSWLASEPAQAHPSFVWWHTFSHRLIAALSLSCGYSSAALRERVFVDIDPSGETRGGILLYTVQPGGDGTLGGLVSLAARFDQIISRAFQDLDACSNDPLCSEEEFGPEKVNGPACYACLFQSETSCEHRNMLLDRQLLLANLP